MARKKGNKPALTGAERTKMYRQRKKLRESQNQRINENLARIEQNVNSLNVATTSANNKEATNGSRIKNQLRSWAAEQLISKRALNDLLSILQPNIGMRHLPKNYRTLQETPINVEIVRAAGGQLWHNSLGKNLTNIFATLSRDITIRLKFNMDGLPIYNSSNISFWPILASIVGL